MTVQRAEIAGVVLAIGAVVTDLVAARQRAAAAADLGALAGAAAAATSSDQACRAAAWVVRENGGQLRRCTVESGDVRVTASAAPRGSWARWLAARLLDDTGPQVSARAGLR